MIPRAMKVPCGRIPSGIEIATRPVSSRKYVIGPSRSGVPEIVASAGFAAASTESIVCGASSLSGTSAESVAVPGRNGHNIEDQENINCSAFCTLQPMGLLRLVEAGLRFGSLGRHLLRGQGGPAIQPYANWHGNRTENLRKCPRLVQDAPLIAV